MSTMERLTAEIGEEAALRLSAQFGGRQLYIAHSMRADSEVVQLIGEAAAARVAKRFGGIFLSLPIGPGRKMRIRAMRADEYTVAEIAAAVGCTDRYVYRVLAEERAEGGTTAAPRRRRKRRAKRKRGGKQKKTTSPPRPAEQRSLWD